MATLTLDYKPTHNPGPRGLRRLHNAIVQLATAVVVQEFLTDSRLRPREKLRNRTVGVRRLQVL